VLKTIVIIVVVVAFVVGGLLALRSSARTGMPGEDVLRRAKERSKQLDQEDKDSSDP
jgi:Protein of unknown function (DUF2897)